MTLLGLEGVWRDPDEETEDYPGLWVHDGRVTGSITLDRSRLPLWTIAPLAMTHGWDEVEHGWDYVGPEYGWDADRMGRFLSHLFEQRGEFGRLVCLLADVERVEEERRDAWFDHAGWVPIDEVDGATQPGPDLPPEPPPWWASDDLRERVADQLRRCLSTLTDENVSSWRERIAAVKPVKRVQIR